MKEAAQALRRHLEHTVQNLPGDQADFRTLIVLYFLVLRWARTEVLRLVHYLRIS